MFLATILGTAIPPHPPDTRRIAMLSDISPRNDRATCNFKSTIRRCPSIVRILACQLLDVEQTWKVFKRVSRSYFIAISYRWTRRTEIKNHPLSGDKRLFSVSFFSLLVIRIIHRFRRLYSTNMNASRIFFFTNIIEKYYYTGHCFAIFFLLFRFSV